MKNSIVVLLVVLSVACTQREISEQRENYLPVTPELESDVMTPEVLWSFGRLGSPHLFSALFCNTRLTI